MTLPAPELAGPADLDALVSLEDVVFAADRISRRSWRHLLGRAHARVLVVRGATVDDPPLLGAAVVLFRRGSASARLYSLAVAPAARGRGIGRSLLDAVLGVSAVSGRDRVSLEVRTDNHAALALYREAGFQETDRLVDYYDDGADGLRMQCAVHPQRGEPWKHLFRLA